MSVQPNVRADERMDAIIGHLLRTGVILAATIVCAGGILFVVRHPLPVTNYHVFQGEPEELRTVPGILRNAFNWHGRGLIQLGLLVLIATPVARVIFSIFAFLYEKDWTYVAVTAVVLALLLFSLLGGHF